MKKTLTAIDFRLFIGCPCFIVGADKPTLTVIVGVDTFSNKVNTASTTERGQAFTNPCGQDPENVKPILRRFENLSRHEIEGLNKLWPSENVRRTTFESIQLDAEIINYLTLLNVDVFGWIDQDLAVDAGCIIMI